MNSNILIPEIIRGAGSTLYLADKVNLLYPLSKARVIIVSSGSQKEFVENSILPQFKKYHSKVQMLVSYGEPDCKTVDQFRKSISEIPLLVIGVGGGSAIDYSKALAALALHKEESHHFLEGVGTIQYSGPALPCVAVPTTAGTGSECTMNTVLSFQDEYSNSWKKSIRHPSLLPKLVFLDPLLTLTLPAQTTLYCGLDAFSQSLEAYISKIATTQTDEWALQSLQKIFENLPIVINEPSNVNARLEMLSASSGSGVALAYAGLGIVHGLAGPLGGLTSFSHGHLCACLLLPTLELFDRECSDAELKLLSDKLKILVPKKYLSRAPNSFIAFKKYFQDWLAKLPTVPRISDMQPEILIEKALEQFSTRNHPTAFSKELAKKALYEIFTL